MRREALMTDMTSPSARDLSTTQLVLRAREGDQIAWDELVERFSSLVWWTARQRGLSEVDAADVSQTTWLRCVQSIEKIREPQAIAGWLVTTARREAIRLSRRAGRQLLVDSEQSQPLDVADPRADVEPDASAIMKEEAEGVRKAIRRLPQRGQDLITALMEDERPNYIAIAEEFSMPVGSIGPTRARQLERLLATPEIQAIKSGRH